MLFNSTIFWLFFAVFFPVYLFLPARPRKWWLLAASYLFYGWWDWRFLSLIFGSTVLDFWCGARVYEHRGTSLARRYLYISAGGNLGVLAVAKYWNFFIESADAGLGLLGWSAPLPTLQIILPVGISFYTFQTMSYTIDIARGKLRPTDSFLDMALYVSFFPQLVAGPIERAVHLLPQLQRPQAISRQDVGTGFFLCMLGMFKKIVIADNLAAIVDPVYNGSASPNLTGTAVWVATYAFAWQIYCDFSGYSDIARGLARMLGVDLMRNFNHPYFAVNPRDFWARWHISLSTWLRDYLYIPLGGNRGGTYLTYRNLLATMLLGGLWHGAGWTYIAWGGWHGAILIGHRWLLARSGGDTGDQPAAFSSAFYWLRAVGMFHLVCISWMLFRAPDMTAFANLAAQVPHVQPVELLRALLFEHWLESALIFWLLACEAHQESMSDDLALLRLPPVVRGLLFAFLYLGMMLLGVNHLQSFIYFQF